MPAAGGASVPSRQVSPTPSNARDSPQGAGRGSHGSLAPAMGPGRGGARAGRASEQSLSPPPLTGPQPSRPDRPHTAVRLGLFSPFYKRKGGQGPGARGQGPARGQQDRERKASPPPGISQAQDHLQTPRPLRPPSPTPALGGSQGHCPLGNRLGPPADSLPGHSPTLCTQLYLTSRLPVAGPTQPVLNTPA